MKNLQWGANQQMIIWLYLTIIICTSYINCLEDSGADQRNESDDLSNDEKSSGYKVLSKRSPLIGDANTSIKTRKKITIIKKKKKVCCITTNEVKKCSEELCKDLGNPKIKSKEFIVQEVDDFEKKVICYYAVHGDYPKNIVPAEWYKYDKSTYWAMPDSELEHICMASIFYRPGIITFAQERVAICHFAEHGSYPIRYKDTTYWSSFDFSKLWNNDDNYLKRFCNIKIIIRPVVQGLYKSSEFYLFQKYLSEKYMKAKKNQNLTHACCLKSDFSGDADEDNDGSFDFMHSDLIYKNPKSKKIEVNIFYNNIEDEGKVKWQGRKKSRGRVTEEQIEEMEESNIVAEEITLEYKNLLLYTIQEKKLEADVICYFRRNGKYPKLYLPISDDLNNSKLWVKSTKELDKMCVGKQIHRPTSGGEEREELDFIISNEIELQSVCHFAKTGKYLTKDNNPAPEIVRSNFWLRSDPWFKLTCGYNRDHPYRPVEFWFGEEMEFSYGEKPDLPRKLLRNSKKINKYWVVNELDWKELENYIYFGGFLKQKNVPKRASRVLFYSEFSNFELFLLKLNSNGFSEGENDQPCCVKRLCAKEVPRIRGRKNTEERVSHNENKINIYQTNIYENQIRKKVKKPQQYRTMEDEEEIEIIETEEYDINKYKKPKRVLKKPVVFEKVQNLRKHKKKEKSETMEEENDLNEIIMRRKSIKILKEHDMHEMENKVVENIDTVKKSSGTLNDERKLRKNTVIRINEKNDDSDNVRVKVTKIRKQFELDTESERNNVEEGENYEGDIIKKRVKLPAKNAKLSNLSLSTPKATKNKIPKNIKKLLVEAPDQPIKNTDIKKTHTVSKVTEGKNSQSKFEIETESRRPLVEELKSVYTYKPITEVITDQKQHIPESGSQVKASAQPSENNTKEKPGALIEVTALPEKNVPSKIETPSSLVKESILKTDNSEVKKNDVFIKKSVKINKQILKTITNPEAKAISSQSKPKPEYVTNLISPNGALEILEENHANSDVPKPVIDTQPVPFSENVPARNASRENNKKNHTTGALSAEKESNAIISPLLSTTSKLNNQESASKNPTQGQPGETFENVIVSPLPSVNRLPNESTSVNVQDSKPILYFSKEQSSPEKTHPEKNVFLLSPALKGLNPEKIESQSENVTKGEPMELSKNMKVPLSKHPNEILTSVLQPEIAESKKLDSVNKESVSILKGKHTQHVPITPSATSTTSLPEDKLPSLTSTSVSQHFPNEDTKQKISLLGGQQSVQIPENKSPQIKVVSTKPDTADHDEQGNLVIPPKKSYSDSSESNLPKTKKQPLKENVISPSEAKLISNSNVPIVSELTSKSVPQYVPNGQHAIEVPGDISNPISIISTKPYKDSKQSSNEPIKVSISGHSKISETDSKHSRTKVVLQNNKIDNLVIASQKNILPSSESNLVKIISSGVPRETPVSSPEDKLIANSKAPLVPNLTSTSVPKHVPNEDTKQKISLLGGQQSVQMLGEKSPPINAVSAGDNNELLQKVNKPHDLGLNSGSNPKQPSNTHIKVAVSGDSKIGPSDSKSSRTKMVLQKHKLDNLEIASQKKVLPSELNLMQQKTPSGTPKKNPIPLIEEKLISNSKAPLLTNLTPTSVPQHVPNEDTKQKISLLGGQVAIEVPGHISNPISILPTKSDTDSKQTSNIKVSVSGHSKIGPTDSKRSRTKIVLQKNKKDNLVIAPQKNILLSSEFNLPKIISSGVPRETPVSSPEDELISNSESQLADNLSSTSLLQLVPNGDTIQKISLLGGQQSVQIPGDKSPTTNVASIGDHNDLLEKVNKPHDLGLNSGSHIKQTYNKNIKVSVTKHSKIGPSDSESSRTKVVIQKNKPKEKFISNSKIPITPELSSTYVPQYVPNGDTKQKTPLLNVQHTVEVPRDIISQTYDLGLISGSKIKQSPNKHIKVSASGHSKMDSTDSKRTKIVIQKNKPNHLVIAPQKKNMLTPSASNLFPIENIPDKNSALDLPISTGQHSIPNIKDSVAKIGKTVPIDSPPLQLDEFEVNSKLPPVSELPLSGSPNSTPTLSNQHISILASDQILPIHGSQQEQNPLVELNTNSMVESALPSPSETGLIKPSNAQTIDNKSTNPVNIKDQIVPVSGIPTENIMVDDENSILNKPGELKPSTVGILPNGTLSSTNIQDLEAKQQDSFVQELVSSYSTKYVTAKTSNTFLPSQVKEAETVKHSSEVNMTAQLLPASGIPTSNIENLEVDSQDSVVKELVTSYSTKLIDSTALPGEVIPSTKPINSTNIEDMEAKQQDSFVQELVSSYSTKHIESNTTMEKGIPLPDQVEPTKGVDTTALPGEVIASTKPTNSSIVPNRANSSSNIEDLEAKQQDSFVQELVSSYSTKHLSSVPHQVTESKPKLESLPITDNILSPDKAADIAKSILPDPNRLNSADLEALEQDSIIKELVSSYSTKHVKTNPSLEDAIFATSSTTKITSNLPKYPVGSQETLESPNFVSSTYTLSPQKPDKENMKPVVSQKAADIKKPKKNIIISVKKNGPQNVHVKVTRIKQKSKSNKNEVQQIGKKVESTNGPSNKNLSQFESKENLEPSTKKVSVSVSKATNNGPDFTNSKSKVIIQKQKNKNDDVKQHEPKFLNVESVLPIRKLIMNQQKNEQDADVKKLIATYNTKQIEINHFAEEKQPNPMQDSLVKDLVTSYNTKKISPPSAEDNLSQSTSQQSISETRPPEELKDSKFKNLEAKEQDLFVNELVSAHSTKYMKNNSTDEEALYPPKEPNIINTNNTERADKQLNMTSQILPASGIPISNIENLEVEAQDAVVKELVTSYSTKDIGRTTLPVEVIPLTNPINLDILSNRTNSNIEDMEAKQQDSFVQELVSSYSTKHIESNTTIEQGLPLPYQVDQTKGVDTTALPGEVIASPNPTNPNILPNRTISSTNIDDVEAKQQDSFVQELVSSYSTKQIESTTTTEKGLPLPDQVEETKGVDTTALPGEVIPSTNPTNSSIHPNRTISSTNIEDMEAKQQDSFVQELVSSYSTKHIESTTTTGKGLPLPDQVEETKGVDTTALPGEVIASTNPTNSSILPNRTNSSTNIEDMEAKQQDSFVQELVSSYSTKHIESITTIEKGLPLPYQVDQTKGVDTTALPGEVIASTNPTNPNILPNRTISSTNIDDVEAKQQDSFVQELVSSYSTKHIESTTTTGKGLPLPDQVEETKGVDTTALPGEVIPSTNPTNSSILPNRTISSINIEDVEAKQQDSFVQELVSSYSTKHIESTTTTGKGLPLPDQVEETKGVDTTALPGEVIPSTNPTNSSILSNRTISSINIEGVEAKQQDLFVQELVSSYSTKHIESTTTTGKGLPLPDQVKETKGVDTTALPGEVIPSTNPTNSSILPNRTNSSTNIEDMEAKQQDSFVQELVSSYSTKHIESNTTIEKGLPLPYQVDQTKGVDTTALPGEVIASTNPTNPNILPNRTISSTNIDDVEAKQQDSFVQELVSSYSTKHIESTTTTGKGLPLPDQVEETKGVDTTALPGEVIPSTNPTNSSILPNRTNSSTNIEDMEAKQQDSFVQELVSSYSTKHIESNTTIEQGLPLPYQVDQTKGVDTTALPGEVIASTNPTNPNILPNRTISSTNIDDVEAKQQDSFVQELVSSYSTKHIESTTTTGKGLPLPDQVEETKGVDTTALPGEVIPSTNPTNSSILPNRTISSINIEDVEAKQQDSFVQELVSSYSTKYIESNTTMEAGLSPPDQVEETKSDKPLSLAYPSKVEKVESTQQDLSVKVTEATNNGKRVETLSPPDNILTPEKIINTSEATQPDHKNAYVEASEANVQDSIVKELVSSYSSNNVKTDSPTEEVILPASNATQNNSDLPKHIIENQEASEDKQQDIFVSELVSSYSNKEHIETMANIPLVLELPNDILKQNSEHNHNNNNGKNDSLLEEIIIPVSNTSQNTPDLAKSTLENQEASEANHQDIFIRELVSSYRNKDNIETMTSIPIVPEMPNDIEKNNSEQDLSVVGSQQAINLPESNSAKEKDSELLSIPIENQDALEAKQQDKFVKELVSSYSDKKTPLEPELPNVLTKPNSEQNPSGLNSQQNLSESNTTTPSNIIPLNIEQPKNSPDSTQQAVNNNIKPLPYQKMAEVKKPKKNIIISVKKNDPENVHVKITKTKKKSQSSSKGLESIKGPSTDNLSQIELNQQHFEASTKKMTVSAKQETTSHSPKDNKISPSVEELSTDKGNQLSPSENHSEAQQQDSIVKELVTSYSTKKIGPLIGEDISPTTIPQKATLETQPPEELIDSNSEKLEAKEQDSFVNELVSAHSTKDIKTNSTTEGAFLPPIDTTSIKPSQMTAEILPVSGNPTTNIEAESQDSFIKELVMSHRTKVVNTTSLPGEVVSATNSLNSSIPPNKTFTSSNIEDLEAKQQDRFVQELVSSNSNKDLRPNISIEEGLSLPDQVKEAKPNVETYPSNITLTPPTIINNTESMLQDLKNSNVEALDAQIQDSLVEKLVSSYSSKYVKTNSPMEEVPVSVSNKTENSSDFPKSIIGNQEAVEAKQQDILVKDLVSSYTNKDNVESIPLIPELPGITKEDSEQKMSILGGQQAINLMETNAGQGLGTSTFVPSTPTLSPHETQHSAKKIPTLGGPEVINIGDKGQGTPAKSPTEKSSYLPKDVMPSTNINENSQSQNSLNLKNEILSTHYVPNIKPETGIDAASSIAASLPKANGHTEANPINKNGSVDTKENPKLGIDQTKEAFTKEDNSKEESTNLQTAQGAITPTPSTQNMGTEIGPMTPNIEAQSPIITIRNKTEVTDMLPNSEIAISKTETEESVQNISVLGAEQSIPDDVVPSLVHQDLFSVKPLDSNVEKIHSEENINPKIENLENKEQDRVLQDLVSSYSTKQIKIDQVSPQTTDTNSTKPNSIPGTDNTLIKPLEKTDNVLVTPPLDNELQSTENSTNLNESEIKNISVLGGQNTINLPKVNSELPVPVSFQNQNKENPVVDDKKHIPSLSIPNGESIREPGLIHQPSSVIDLISPRPLDHIRKIDSNQIIPCSNNNPNPMNPVILNKPEPAVPDYKELLDSIQKSCNCDLDLLENKLKLYTEDLVRNELRKFSYDLMEYVKREIDHKFEECQNTKKNVPCEQDNPFFY